MPSDPRGSKSAPAFEVIEPVGKRVLIRKDEDKKQTKSGIHLPDKIEIPTLTGRVVAVSAEVERNEDYPIKKYDRVLFNPKHGIPVEDIVAIFRREAETPAGGTPPKGKES